ncbi:MAG TPA: hypothetical protein GX697_06390, partial [Firmicutes bacterium]|nr:hypothetical protein [Bacillota bacterium]
AAIEETERRRRIQMQYNKDHGITPVTIQKAVRDVIEATRAADEKEPYFTPRKLRNLSREEKVKAMADLEKEMNQAARNLQFERAAELRDMLFELKREAALKGSGREKKIRRKQKQTIFPGDRRIVE